MRAGTTEGIMGKQNTSRAAKLVKMAYLFDSGPECCVIYVKETVKWRVGMNWLCLLCFQVQTLLDTPHWKLLYRPFEAVEHMR